MAAALFPARSAQRGPGCVTRAAAALRLEPGEYGPGHSDPARLDCGPARPLLPTRLRSPRPEPRDRDRDRDRDRGGPAELPDRTQRPPLSAPARRVPSPAAPRAPASSPPLAGLGRKMVQKKTAELQGFHRSFKVRHEGSAWSGGLGLGEPPCVLGGPGPPERPVRGVAGREGSPGSCLLGLTPLSRRAGLPQPAGCKACASGVPAGLAQSSPAGPGRLRGCPRGFSAILGILGPPEPQLEPVMGRPGSSLGVCRKSGELVESLGPQRCFLSEREVSAVAPCLGGRDSHLLRCESWGEQRGGVGRCWAGTPRGLAQGTR